MWPGRTLRAAAWVDQAAAQLGLESSLRSAGRPRRASAADTGQSDLFTGEVF